PDLLLFRVLFALQILHGPVPDRFGEKNIIERRKWLIRFFLRHQWQNQTRKQHGAEFHPAMTYGWIRIASIDKHPQFSCSYLSKHVVRGRRPCHRRSLLLISGTWSKSSWFPEAPAVTRSTA